MGALLLISTSDLDHSLSAKKIENMGIRVFRPYTIEDKKFLKTRIGSFNITSFDVPHNGTENRGFLITVDGKTICYITDFEYCPYNFKEMQINTMLVECNYDKRIIDDKKPNYKHSVLGHCELQTCIKFLEENKTEQLNNILLIHPSKDNLDKEIALKDVINILGNEIKIAVASPGYELEV